MLLPRRTYISSLIWMLRDIEESSRNGTVVELVESQYAVGKAQTTPVRVVEADKRSSGYVGGVGMAGPHDQSV